jgi:hypothetical protein
MELEPDTAVATPGKARPYLKDGQHSTHHRLRNLSDLDGRTTSAKRARQLVSSLENDLGGSDSITTAVRQLIQHAALLGAYIEDAETRWLRHEQVELSDFLHAINSQRRLLTVLGLSRVPRDVTATQNDELKRILGYMQEAGP